MEQSLFTDGQVAALTAAIVAGLGAVAAAIRWAFGSFAKALDNQSAAFKAMADEHRAAKEALIELRGVVQEGRADIGEIRLDVAAVARTETASGEHPVRRHRRPATAPSGER